MPTIQTLIPSTRPRERLQAHGVAAASLEEVLAAIIGSGSGRIDVLSLAAAVAAKLRTGSATTQELADIPGIGTSRALQIIASLHLGAKVRQVQQSMVLDTSLKVYEAMRDVLEKTKEHLAVFFLDSHCQSLRREIISIGTVSATLAHPREVFRPAISCGASYIIVAHNHPSGSLLPSSADEEMTRQLYQAGLIVGIDLLDHVICAQEDYYSLAHHSPHLFINQSV